MDNFEENVSEKIENALEKNVDNNNEINKTKKSRKKIIVILTITILLLMVVGSFATYVMWPRMSPSRPFIPEWYSNPDNPGLSLDKPIIYLYPEYETEVTVKLENSHLVTCSYPKYIHEWNVNAQPNGNLFDTENGRNLYALYYESEPITNFKVEKTGFIVEGDKVIEFLEEKLELLGLNEREAEEFIVYWLPKLEANKYNYIRFATIEEIEANMPLEITPVPETMIRVLMTYKGLEEKIDTKEQTLIKPERKGFTVVEWGATEIR